MILIRYYYTPMHCCVANLITAFIIWIILIIKDQAKVDFIGIIVVGHLFLFIGSLIYNEIIICYFFGLEEYTQKEIMLRSDKEFAEARLVDSNSETEFPNHIIGF